MVSIGDGIARVYGCEACLAGELLEFADGSLGLALNLESQTVGAVRFASSFGTQTCTEGSPWSGRRIRWRTSLWGNSTEAVSSTPGEAMIPIGRGQRVLIIGDRQTGKQPTPATA